MLHVSNLTQRFQDDYSEDYDMEWMNNVFIPLGLKSRIGYFERYRS